MYDYLKLEIGKTSAASSIAKLGLVSLVFFGGYFGGGSNHNRGMYTTRGVNIVNKEIGNEDFGFDNMEFLEANKERLYLPTTDGKGNIKSLFKIDKIVFDLEKNNRYYEGIVYRLQEGGQIKVDTKTLDNER